MTNTGGFNFQDMFSQMGGMNQVGGTVGNETPEWDFPIGIDRVPESVRSFFLRGDAGPSGLNQFLATADPKVIDEFRSAINMGVLRPKNQAASNISKGYGGLRAGDEAGPGGILGPMQDDMPSGLSPEYWQQANTLISTMIDAQMKAADASGYFNNMPTIQREQIMQQLAQGWKQQFTEEFKANESKRAAMAQEGLSQQEINNQNLQSMAKIMGGTVNPQTGQYQQTEEGRQFDTTATGYINGQRTLAGEAQDWGMQKDVANAAANPRDYIYAQMLGNARGGLAGQPATNQLQMPGSQPPGMNGAAQNGFNPAAWGQQGAGAPGAGQPGMNPLASTQPPGTSGAGTLAPGADQWAQMCQQAQAAQDQARGAMMGAQQGPGAGAASGLSPGPGSPEMVGGYPGYQGAQGLPGGQDGAYGPVANMSGGIDPAMLAARQAAQGGQPGAGAPSMERQQLLGQPSGMGGLQFQAPQGGQYYGQLERMQPGGLGVQRPAPAAPGMPGQAPGQRPGMPQPQQGQTSPQFTTSAFTQQLLKNRMVPGSGGIQGQGSYMSQQQLQKSLNPNKIRAQDFMRGRDSEQKGFLGAASAAGYSDEDTLGAIKNNAPKFQAPGAGRMI